MMLIGWGLGILSSPITDAIRRRSAKRRLTRAIRTELATLEDTLAGVVVNVSRRRCVLTPSLLEALMTTLRSSGLEASSGKTIKVIEGLLELDENALAAASQGPDTSSTTRGPLTLKASGWPFFESQLQRLDLFSTETQRLLAEIRAGVQVFDQHAGEAMNYHLMTFSSGMDKEHLEMLKKNVERCYERAAEKASDLVSRIAGLLQSPEMQTG